MATAAITVTKRVCDRCGDTVTDSGGRFALDPSKGPVDLTSFIVSPIVMPVPDQIIRDTTEALCVDLCRGCKGSLLSWWDRASPRRAAAKEGTGT